VSPPAAVLASPPAAIDPDPTTASSEGPAEGPAEDEAVDGATDSTEGKRERRRFKEVWLVEDRREGRSMWTRVGTAFENADGSWNIRLSALPVGAGRLNMRDPLVREKPADDAASKPEQRASESRLVARGEPRVAA
ncbi:MAG TPA: hypothetical protein VGF99_20215, partial [Myxococcota bacterium]